MHKDIGITYDEAIRLFYIDNCGVLRNKIKRGCAKKDNQSGCINSKGYIHLTYKGKTIKAHHISWLIDRKVTPKEGMMIDHKDNNKQNNLPGNLRQVSNSGNQKNRLINSNSVTGVKGVYMQNGKYIASIQSDGNREYIGTFHSIESASLAIAEKRKNIHKEFANNG